jgi:hypothetical protein
MLSLVTSAALVAAAVLALGPPDPSRVGGFLTSDRPTHDGAVAAVQFLVWSLIGALVFVQTVGVVRRSKGAADELRTRRLRARAALVVGLLILAGGTLRHQTQPGSLCCGDVSRADRLLR